LAESILNYKPEGMSLFCMFKGDPGTGKTPAAASFPEPYIADVDGRIASVVNYWAPKGKEVHYDSMTNNYPKLCAKLEALIRYNPYQTVVIDSITTIARSLHTLMFEARGAGAQAKDEYDDKDKKKRVYMNAAKIPGKFEGIPVLEIDDYKTESTGLIQILDGCRVLWNDGKGCNIIVIAHVVEVENRDLKNRVTRTRSIMTGGRKIAAEIPVYFNEAYHFYNTVSGGFEIITKADGEDWAKTALNLPQRIDFTDKNLYDEIDAYRRGEKVAAA
jgi:hypothetical protein